MTKPTKKERYWIEPEKRLRKGAIVFKSEIDTDAASLSPEYPYDPIDAEALGEINKLSGNKYLVKLHGNRGITVEHEGNEIGAFGTINPAVVSVQEIKGLFRQAVNNVKEHWQKISTSLKRESDIEFCESDLNPNIPKQEVEGVPDGQKDAPPVENMDNVNLGDEGDTVKKSITEEDLMQKTVIIIKNQGYKRIKK